MSPPAPSKLTTMQEAQEFTVALEDSLKILIYEKKIMPQLLIGILMQQVYNIQRTCETDVRVQRIISEQVRT